MSRQSLKTICKLIDNANKELTVEQSFLIDLKRTIEKSAESEHRKPSQTYKPSSMKCIRSMYYQVTGADCEEGNTTYCGVGICNSGTDIHIRIQQAVEQMKNFGIDCEYVDVAEFVQNRNLTDIEIREKSGMETKLYYKKYNMSFMCDGIIRYNNHYYILELKTEASFKWNTRNYVDASHYEQGTAYSIAFDLPEVLFLYINRDILDMKAYLFVPPDEMKQDLIAKIMECDSCVERNCVPEKPDDIPKKVCEYCSYKNRCKGDI